LDNDESGDQQRTARVLNNCSKIPTLSEVMDWEGISSIHIYSGPFESDMFGMKDKYIVPTLITETLTATIKIHSFKLKTNEPTFLKKITYSVSTILASRYDEIITRVPCNFQYETIMCLPLK
jgi:hypothetical protein